MHIVIISDLETHGGAAEGTSCLASEFINLGHKVTRIVAFPDGINHDWKTLHIKDNLNQNKIFNIILRCIKRISLKYYTSLSVLSVKRTLNKILKNVVPDLIYVNNVHYAGWLPNVLMDCNSVAPIVWTLYDMWSFTGRCTYSYSCKDYKLGCNQYCPTPNEYPALNPSLIEYSWMLRKKFIDSNPELVAICPSSWLAGKALEGLWKNNRVEVIPNGLPLDIFKPCDKEIARKELDIKYDGLILGIAAANLKDQRKGIKLFVDSLYQLKNVPLKILSIGEGALLFDIDGIRVDSLGYLKDQRTKVLFYNAVDFIVFPSLEDNLPFVVMESIACATPVVAFPVGGVVEMVRPGVTGWLTNSISSKELADLIDSVINEFKSNEINMSCRKIAENEYDSKIQAMKYIELFQSLQ